MDEVTIRGSLYIAFESNQTMFLDSLQQGMLIFSGVPCRDFAFGFFDCLFVSFDPYDIFATFKSPPTEQITSQLQILRRTTLIINLKIMQTQRNKNEGVSESASIFRLLISSKLHEC